MPLCPSTERYHAGSEQRTPRWGAGFSALTSHDLRLPHVAPPFHPPSGSLEDAYIAAVDTRSDDFGGASKIRTTPMTTNAATPHSSPRGMRLRSACTAISAAWARLDHAVKAIRLRFADGSRAASNKKMPSVTYRLSIIASAGSCRTNIVKG